MKSERQDEGVTAMTVTDPQTAVEPMTAQDQVRREFAGASWFRLAAATAQAHSAADRARRDHRPGREADAQAALERHAVLKDLLSAETARLAARPVYGSGSRD